MIDFPTAKHKFSFFLDRKNKKVTVDINSGARVYSKHFEVESLSEDSTIRSLALVFQKSNMALFLDCKKIGVQDLEVDINQLYANMDDPVLKLVSGFNLILFFKIFNHNWFPKFRERKYPLHFDFNIADALFRANCQKTHNRKEYKRHQSKSSFMGMAIENQLSENPLGPEKNRKRDVRDWQREDRGFKQAHNIPAVGETTNIRRGDIPVIHGDCDGEWDPGQFSFNN